MRTTLMVLTCCLLASGCDIGNFLDKKATPTAPATPEPTAAPAIPAPTATPATTDPTAGWTEHRTLAFSIRAPGIPRFEQGTAPSKIGPIPMTTYEYPVRNDSQVLMVSVGDFSSFDLEKADSHALLAHSRDGMIKNMNAKVIKETPFTMKGHPGLDLSFEAEGPGLLKLKGRARIVMTKHKLIVAMHGHELDGAELARAGDKFVESLVVD